MMNGPFFRNYSSQQPSHSSRSVPVQRTQQKPSPKVISVPVHFVSSDQPPTTISMLKDSAAIKIQKVFRGFAVRKSVKKIDSIRHEVTEIERRINNIEVVNLIRGDARERLRVNETLMALLFKLDSIRGVDSGVRDLRKAVTKKAIALQEKVDSIAIAKPDHQTLDSHSPEETDIDNVCTSTSDQVITKATNSVDEIVNHLEAVDRVEAAGVIGEVECMETGPAVNSSEFDDVHKQSYGKENREILGSLMDDNEQMMRLMKQISERNEMQTRIINDLSRRVEQLEKAEKLRKKRARVPCRRRMRDKEMICIWFLGGPFCGRPLFTSQRKLSYNGLDITFSPYNEYWREMRKIFTIHLFSPKRIQSIRYVREDEVSSAMKLIHDLALSCEKVNLSEMMKNVTSNIMMRVSFGKKYQDGNERNKVLGLLNKLQAHLVDLYVSDIWPGLPFVGLVDRLMGKTNRLEKCFRDLDSFYQQLIDERLNTQKQKSFEEDEDDAINILLQLVKNKLFNLTHDHIKAMLMDVLVAGTDTSAATVVWAMTSLIKNPNVMRKAQQEVRNVIGNNGEIDEDGLSKLSYLKAVIKETLRLYPPAPLLVPRETREDTIIHGYKIKQKSLVYINAWAIGRDPKSWDNPEEFNPERFLGGCDIDFKGNDFELIPFGAGRRICPGMSVGVVIVELLLANLLYWFDWGLPDGTTKEDIDFDAMSGITMHKRNELCLLAHVCS
ncbi:6,7,8-trihydroxycoumarin synthase-like [Bidens hawaiensis]|uniref:6,7,8-trihydroxycoumarin synthase-like n=1 Tax=Bidens hawaiensis TaxID=980011 RepID=UPI00404A5D58